jgi:hypothetical protein
MSTSTPIGMVIAELEDDADGAEAAALVKQAAIDTPPGRHLAVIYPLPGSWEASEPLEAAIVAEVLGPYYNRVSLPEWEFFGNLSVRICKASSRGRAVAREVGVVLFRRVGKKPYERRRDLTACQLEDASLPTLHPVFTRDVANNMWHLPAKGWKGKLRSRLASLLTWPDERAVLLCSDGHTQSLRVEQPDYAEDLIPVPTKTYYAWVSGQSPLFTE